jgi:hypothetical protein
MSDTDKKPYELKLTGKVNIVIEVEEFNPISININNKELAMELVRMLIDNTDDEGVSLKVSTEEMNERYTQIIGEIE